MVFNLDFFKTKTTTNIYTSSLPSELFYGVRIITIILHLFSLIKSIYSSIHFEWSKKKDITAIVFSNYFSMALKYNNNFRNLRFFTHLDHKVILTSIYFLIYEHIWIITKILHLSSLKSMNTYGSELWSYIYLLLNLWTHMDHNCHLKSTFTNLQTHPKRTLRMRLNYYSMALKYNGS